MHRQVIVVLVVLAITGRLEGCTKKLGESCKEQSDCCGQFYYCGSTNKCTHVYCGGFPCDQLVLCKSDKDCVNISGKPYCVLDHTNKHSHTVKACSSCKTRPLNKSYPCESTSECCKGLICSGLLPTQCRNADELYNDYYYGRDKQDKKKKV